MDQGQPAEVRHVKQGTPVAGTSGPRPRRAIRHTLAVLFFLAALSSMVFLVIQVTGLWVDVPFADDWDVSVVFDKHYDGGVDLRTLFSQHNESRKAFPRLIILGLGLLSRYDVRWEQCVTLLFAFLISLNLLSLLKRLEWLPSYEQLFLYLICNLFLFSPAQWINWLTGIQMVVFMPPLMLTWGLLLTSSSRRIWSKTLGASLLSFIGTYSYANGMLLWLLLCPPELFGIRLRRLLPRRSLLTLPRIWYAASALASLLFYFHEYHKPPQSPPFAAAWEDPVRTLSFLLAWSGGSLSAEGSRHSDSVAIALGGLVLAAFLLGLWKTFIARKAAALYPWMALGLYSLMSGLITTAGRVGDGLAGARVSRYVSFSLYLPVATIALLWGTRTRRRWPTLAYACCLAGVLFFDGQQVIDATEKMAWFSRHLRDGRLAIQLHRVVRDDSAIWFLYPNLPRVLERLDALQRQGMLNFHPVDPGVFPECDDGIGQGDAVNGFFDRCTPITPDVLRCSGWAYLAPRQSPATNVILTWQEPDGPAHPFALFRVNLTRLDVASRLGQPEEMPLGFVGLARLPENRPERVVVSAWTIDTEQSVAYKLKGSHPIRSGDSRHDGRRDTQRPLEGTAAQP